MRCLFSHQLKINSFGLTLSRYHVQPGCTTRTFSNICLHCLTYAHTLPESREMWHFRMKCVLDDMAWRTRSCNLLLSFLFPLPSRAGSLHSPEFSYGRFDVIRH